MALLVVAASFVVPKLFLVDSQRALWLSLSTGDVLRVCLQDIAVAVLVFMVADVFLGRAGPRRFVVAAFLSCSAFVAILLDVRTRQLWLQPVSVNLIKFGLAFGSDLRSGLPLFFNLLSGWGMTFRRALVVLAGAHLMLWGALVLVARHRATDSGNSPRFDRRRLLVGTVVFVLLLLVSARTARYRYDLQDNLLTRWAVHLLRAPERSPRSDLASSFEEKVVPTRTALRGERRILQDVKPFKNLVLVFMESVRWRDFAARDTPLHVLHRLADQGLLADCYAPVPHSGKGYFSVLSGRYPYPGIEMREAFALQQPGLFGTLRDRLGLHTFVFASLHLAFENTGGIMRSLGVNQLFQTQDLARADGGYTLSESSFGSEDGPLYRLAAQFLATRAGPFGAVFLPRAAHYPYDYPDKPVGEGATHSAYVHSLAETDRLIGELVVEFTKRGLVNDTLFVLVGDHGESFNEHGVWVHNSSVYEEEVTVPLVLWSADGRLKASRIEACRQIDIAPTVLDLFGEFDAPLPVQGVSLLRGGQRPPAYFATFIDGLALAVSEPPQKYIYEVAADRLLRFDLASDPEEHRPQQVDGEQKVAVVERLRAFEAYQRGAFPTEPVAKWPLH